VIQIIFKTKPGGEYGFMREIIKRVAARPIRILNNAVLGSYLYLAKVKVKEIKAIDVSRKRILILSPHQDDEILGCGCLIKKALEEKGSVKCIYMTDGSQSLSDELTPEALAELRKVEAIELAKNLGMEEPVFMDYPDGDLKVDDEGAEKIAGIIEDYKPDIIFLPYFLDGHKDHTAVSGIFIASVELLKKHKKFDTYCYEVNSPISVHGITHYMDCSGYLKAKKGALEFYSSQTMSFESIFEMNKLNRIIVGTSEGAELFRYIDLESYKNAYNRYNKNNEIYSRFRQMYSIYFMIPAYFKGLSIKKEVALFQNSGADPVRRKDESGKGTALNKRG